MRRVSRTHKVALDWLFDRINLDPKIQIKYGDTKHQLADILTEGNCTRYEWNNLLHLFNISHFHSLCCSQSFSLTSCTETMATRMQEQSEDKRGSWQSQSRRWTRSHRGYPRPCRKDWSTTGKLEAREFFRDATSSSQGWQKDAVLDVSTRKIVASGNSEIEVKDEIWPHNLHVSTVCVPHMEKVFSFVKQRYGLSPRDEMEDLDVNTAIQCIFMSVTLQAAVHLGKDHTENMRSTKNQPKKSSRLLFQLTQKLITGQTEITGITTIDWRQRMWRETTLLTDRAVQFATARTYVFSDSVLCLGGISKVRLKFFFLETHNFKRIGSHQRSGSRV